MSSVTFQAHMSVAANMGFAPKTAGVPKQETDTRVRRATKILDLEDCEHVRLSVRPDELHAFSTVTGLRLPQ